MVPYPAQAEPPKLPPLAGSDGSLPEFTDGSTALAPDATVHGACQFCNSLCRLTIGMKAGRVIDIRGERQDPVQDGNLCVKGPMTTQLAYNPLRLTTPLKRVGGAKGDPDSQFEPVSWDEALDIIAGRFLALRDQGEARAIANRTTGRLPRGTGSLVHRLFTLLGSPNDTDVGPVCNDAGGNALAATFGLGNFTNGYGVDESTCKEDLASARYFLFLGTDQAETQPVTFAHLLRGRERTGAKLVVVDPRRTPTAAVADQWVAPKPHTDFALVLGLLHEVITKGRYDKAFVDRWVLGFDELRDHIVARRYTAEWAATVTGVRPAPSVSPGPCKPLQAGTPPAEVAVDWPEQPPGKPSSVQNATGLLDSSVQQRLIGSAPSTDQAATRSKRPRQANAAGSGRRAL